MLRGRLRCGPIGWVAALGALALVAGCGTSESSTTTTAVPATNTVADVLDESVEPSTEPTLPQPFDGVAASWRLTDPTNPDDSPGGTLTLEACRWRAPDLYTFDLNWRSTDASSEPAELPIALQLGGGDTPRALVWGVVDLRSPGSFSITLDTLRQGSRPDLSLAGVESERQPFTCSASSGVGEWGQVASTVDAIALTFERTEPDTVQDLVDGVVLDDPTGPQLVLARLVRENALEVDRFFLDPGRVLTSLGVDRQGTCLSVEATFGPGVSVWQERGCDPATGPVLEGVAVDVVDDAWQVHAVAPTEEEARALAAAVRAFRDVRVPPLGDAPTFDADAWFDGYLIEHPDVVEVGRLVVDGTPVMFRTGGPEFWFSEAIWEFVVPTDVEFLSSGGVGCMAYTIGEFDGPFGDGAFTIAWEPDLRFVIGERELTLEPGRNDWSLGVHPLEAGERHGDIAVLDSEGAEVPCEQ